MEGRGEQTKDLMEEKDANEYFNTSRIKERMRNERKRLCSLKVILPPVVVLLMFAVAVATICMLALYIQRLQQREAMNIQELQQREAMNIQELKSRLDSVEKQLSGGCCLDNDVGLEPMHGGMRLEERRRGKRHVLSANSSNPPVNAIRVEESEHIRNEHHGLASSHIALLYANPRQINVTSDAETDPNSPLRIVQSTKDFSQLCSKVLENRRGDTWCLPHSSHQKGMFMMEGQNGHYPYFSQAPWMNSRLARQNFQFTGSDHKKLIVKRAGIYIVASNMHFAHVQSEALYYGVYKSNATDDDEQLLGVCAFSASNTGSGGAYPCPTWQLASLNAGDRVYMNISGSNWFNINTNFFLAVIKLNDWRE